MVPPVLVRLQPTGLHQTMGKLLQLQPTGFHWMELPKAPLAVESGAPVSEVQTVASNSEAVALGYCAARRSTGQNEPV